MFDITFTEDEAAAIQWALDTTRFSKVRERAAATARSKIANRGRHVQRAELLQNIAAGLNQYGRSKVSGLEVVFYQDGDQVLSCGLATALDYLADDGSQADRAEVRWM